MAQIGNVPEIKAVKQHLDYLKETGLVADWNLPYENLLTRLSAAIFFLTPGNANDLDGIWKELQVHKGLTYELNTNTSLSPLKWKVQFNALTK